MELLQAAPAYKHSFGMENRDETWRVANQNNPQDASVQRRMAIANISSSSSSPPGIPGPTYLPPSPSQGASAQRAIIPPRLPPISRTVSASQPHPSGERLANLSRGNHSILSSEIDLHRQPGPGPSRVNALESNRTPVTGSRAIVDGSSAPANSSGRHSPQKVSPPKLYQGSLLTSPYPSETNSLLRGEHRARGVHPPGRSLDRCLDCADVASLTQQVISSLLNLDLEIQTTVAEKPPPSQAIPDPLREGSWKALHWALDTIQDTTKVLRQRRGQRSSASPYPNEFKRKDDLTYDDHAAKRSRTGSVSGVNPRHYTTQPPAEPPPSSSRNIQMSQPKMSPQARLPPGAWTASAGEPGEEKARTSYLEELQHDVNVKALKLSTLQREHDSLLQKLERQRTKCATLERKFETSDMEINSLSDERERLQSQLTVLENQVENLQKDRDEARSQSVANNGQYLKIVELSSRLQKQAAEDKKRWNAERAELLTTLRQAREQTLMRDQANESARSEQGEMGALLSERKGTGKQKVTENVSDADYDPSWLEEETDPCTMSVEELQTRNKLLRLALIDVKKEIQVIQQATQRINTRGNILRANLLNAESDVQEESPAESENA